ncbi:MAG: hypothetical protein LBI14_03335 [Treponema sp.]|nr:hypothetical protein [Treponema sp.]
MRNGSRNGNGAWHHEERPHAEAHRTSGSRRRGILNFPSSLRPSCPQDSTPLREIL